MIPTSAAPAATTPAGSTPSPSPRRSDAPEGPDGAIQVLPVDGIGEVRAGDDLVAVLSGVLGADSPCPARDGDVLCVSSKIVSKARGLVAPPEGKDAALAAATVRTVARRRHGSVTTSVVETTSGPVLAGAGIDASNTPDGLLLLPADPDGEARALRAGLEAALGVRLGVVLTDTASRIWRTGTTDLALGADGVVVSQDLRGTVDDTGRVLGVTVRAVGDEIAAAADLAKGKASRRPVAIVRGLPDALTGALPGALPGTLHGTPADATGEPAGTDGSGARALVRTGPDDWFRRPSLESVWQAMGLAAHDEPVAAMSPEPDDERIERALDVARCERSDAPDASGAADATAGSVDSAVPVDHLPARAHRRGDAILVEPPADTPAGWAAAGALAERIRTALGAEAIASPLPPLVVRVGAPADPASQHRGVTP